MEEDGDIWSDRVDGRQEFEGEAGRRIEGAFKRMRYPLYIDSGAAGTSIPLPNANPTNQCLHCVRGDDGRMARDPEAFSCSWRNAGTAGGLVPAHLRAGPVAEKGMVWDGHAVSHMLWNSHVRSV